ncbi:polysaccharide pyruvyl transferase family protein [Kiritimatiellaeota bacterium B1221]|nr:polysaccharide pyruvyl transferase family protein [Kiritimatiellaeota bacterium B1221]
MKTMVIGLGPEYNYPKSFDVWKNANTRYASNHGASLISKSIIDEFDADYIDDFTDIKKLRNEYDYCVLATSTHIHPNRDVTEYAEVIEKLDLPTLGFSLGIQDYHTNTGNITKIHPSVVRLLKAVGDRSEFIGVRGPYTASVLYKFGFKNVVPIGCPTLYRNGDKNFKIQKKRSYNNPLVVFHHTMFKDCIDLLKSCDFLGQDYEDEMLFTDHLDDDTLLKEYIETKYSYGSDNVLRELIKKRGKWVNTSSEWLDMVGKQDFVIGPRIHGCIAAITQGVPALLTPRDLRVLEFAEFYGLPYVPMSEVQKYSLEELYDTTNYEKFNKNFPVKYQNFLSFLSENNAPHVLNADDCTEGMTFTVRDFIASNYIACNEIEEINRKIESLDGKYYKLLKRKIKTVLKKLNII